ncbi:MAG: MarR family transcriptional regulator [Planctomycetes bacterium]|nr:MarR family transcriptional regulator [Planctomycetota bacterium]
MAERTPKPTTAREEIRQQKPFDSVGQEAVITLMLTQDLLQHRLEAVFAEHDITAQQFNVLRILRGSRPDGLKTLDIADRMVQRTPGITRLLDRLELKGLVSRERSSTDRRQVWCKITAKGLALLTRLDAPTAEFDRTAFRGLSVKETTTLVRLLNKVRHAHR